MTDRHELSQRQLRALLLLLVLLPLSPTVMMFRFMVETVKNEHAAAEERLGDIYRQALAGATGSLAGHFKEHDGVQAATAEEVFKYYRRVLDFAVQIRVVVGADGRVLAGDAPGGAAAIAEDSAGEVLPGAVVQLVAAPRTAVILADGEVNKYGWVVAAAAVVNLVVSGAAAVALHRQSRLRELQNTALATVAHELKTPLASMRVLTDTLLQTPAPDPERSRGYVSLIAAENDRLIRLTENFLTLSRFETVAGVEGRTSEEPVALAEAAVRSMESRFKEAGIEPETFYDKDLPMVTVNRECVEVVLVNLLDNAVKYSEVGKPIALRVQRRNGAVEFSVEDHGIGIAEEVQGRIFDRFFQADQTLARSREGCGLGLHIARSIVEAHGGTVTVKSALGEGSAFCVSLPVTKTA